MPLKYQGNDPAPIAPVAAAPSKGDTTRQELFNPDGSPKPVRNLAAIRSQLAGNPGVNPPESRPPESEPAESGGPEQKPVQPLPDTPTTRRTRRTPAQMAEARAAASVASATPSTDTTSQPVTGAAAGSPLISTPQGSVVSLRAVETDQLIAELLRRLRFLGSLQ